MFQAALGRRKTRFPGNGEKLAKVQRLPRVDEVHDPVGTVVLPTETHRGKIRRRVQIPAIALLHDQRRLEFVEKDALRTVVNRDQASAFEIGDDVREIVVVAALRVQIPVAERDAKRLVHRSAMGQ